MKDFYLFENVPSIAYLNESKNFEPYTEAYDTISTNYGYAFRYIFYYAD